LENSKSITLQKREKQGGISISVSDVEGDEESLGNMVLMFVVNVSEK
jgi:hypothetical protein|tara:strand:- start:1762 stop:1902 length:141 start_codon:yes stop_codon:yes gene_type:complete